MAGELEPPQREQGEEVADVQAVRGRVEAGVDGLRGGEQLRGPGGVGLLRDQLAPARSCSMEAVTSGMLFILSRGAARGYGRRRWGPHCRAGARAMSTHGPLRVRPECRGPPRDLRHTADLTVECEANVQRRDAGDAENSRRTAAAPAGRLRRPADSVSAIPSRSLRLCVKRCRTSDAGPDPVMTVRPTAARRRSLSRLRRRNRPSKSRGARLAMPLQPVTLMLSRTDLSAPDAERQLTPPWTRRWPTSVRTQGRTGSACCPPWGVTTRSRCGATRQAPERDWLNLLGSFPSFKKMDVQHGYAESDALDAFWRVLQGDDYPVLLLSYLRTRDNVVLAHGSYAFRSLERRLRTDLPPDRSLVVRTVGWPDFAVLLLGDDMEDLLRQAQQVWGLRPGPVVRGDGERAVVASRAKDNEPAFSRSFSLLAYDENSPRPLRGELLPPQHLFFLFPPPLF